MGDSAILITLGDEIVPRGNALAHRLSGAIRELGASDHSWGSPVPAYASVLVPYEPTSLPAAEAIEILRTVVDRARGAFVDDDDAPAETIEIAVRYGGEAGPDLAQVAALHGLSEKEVVALHSGTSYRVYMLGFAPGFAYLGPVPEEIATPRRAVPRTRVPAGSVGIAGRQTGVYPFSTPGGWQLIGRTQAVLWDPALTPPALLAPGGMVRFVALEP